jgi:hypothetical protein
MYRLYEFNTSCVMACASIVGHKTQQWLGCGGTPAGAGEP